MAVNLPGKAGDAQAASTTVTTMANQLDGADRMANLLTVNHLKHKTLNPTYMFPGTVEHPIPHMGSCEKSRNIDSSLCDSHAQPRNLQQPNENAAESLAALLCALGQAKGQIFSGYDQYAFAKIATSVASLPQ